MDQLTLPCPAAHHKLSSSSSSSSHRSAHPGSIRCLSTPIHHSPRAGDLPRVSRIPGINPQVTPSPSFPHRPPKSPLHTKYKTIPALPFIDSPDPDSLLGDYPLSSLRDARHFPAPAPSRSRSQPYALRSWSRYVKRRKRKATCNSPFFPIRMRHHTPKRERKRKKKDRKKSTKRRGNHPRQKKKPTPATPQKNSVYMDPPFPQPGVRKKKPIMKSPRRQPKPLEDP